MSEAISPHDPMTCDSDELVEMIAEAGASAKDLWPPALAELVDVLEDYFARHHSDSGARFWAESVVTVIANHFGGRATYLPRGDGLRRALRDLRICQEFDGKNASELARRNRLSVPHVRRILKSCHYLRNGKPL